MSGTHGSASVVRLPGSPVVSLSVAVVGGSSEDPEHLPGLAHLLEHLVSPGPDAGGPLDRLGGRRNAVTQQETTIFTSTFALTDDHPALLRDELHRLRPRPVTHDDVLREAEVIGHEEAAGASRGAARTIWAELPALALGTTAARFAGTGDPAALAGADVDEVGSALASRYVAARTHTVVVGDVDPDVVAEVLRTGAPFPSRPAPRAAPVGPLPAPVGTAPDAASGRPGAVVVPVEPARADPDLYLARLVLCRLLRRAGAGRFAAFLGLEGRWWSSARTDLLTLVLLRPDALDDLRRTLAGPWPDGAVDQALSLVALDLGRSVESAALRAQQLAGWQALVGVPHRVGSLLRRPGPASRADVGDVVDVAACRLAADQLLDALDPVGAPAGVPA